MKSWLTGHLGCTVAHGDVADKHGLFSGCASPSGTDTAGWESPRKQDAGINDQCHARCPDLPKVI
jgi:hypothetical protein